MEENMFKFSENKYLSSLNNLSFQNDQEVILGVDNMNIFYLWSLQFKNEFISEKNEMEDFNEIFTIMPSVGCFVDVKSISKVKKLNENTLICCGDSNSYLIDIEEFEKCFNNCKKQKNSLEIRRIRKKRSEFKDKAECNSLINGFDIDHFNNRLLTYSDNDYAFIFDIETQKTITKLSKLSLQLKPYVPSVLCGSLLPEYNKVLLGLSEGYAQFYDTRSSQYIGTFSPFLNQFFNNKESLQISHINQKINDSISAVCRYSNNSLIFGCNSYGFKYNLDINIITQVYQNKGQINDILVNDNLLYFCSNNRSVLKYDISGKVLGKTNSSSSCVFSIDQIKFNGKEAFAVSGNSNCVDVFKNEIVLKLIY